MRWLLLRRAHVGAPSESQIHMPGAEIPVTESGQQLHFPDKSREVCALQLAALMLSLFLEAPVVPLGKPTSALR